MFCDKRPDERHRRIIGARGTEQNFVIWMIERERRAERNRIEIVNAANRPNNRNWRQFTGRTIAKLFAAGTSSVSQHQHR